jgi:hypothetical protein
MQRRQFLMSAGAVAGLAAMPFGGVEAAVTRLARFALLRADDAVAGAPFIAQSLAPCPSCTVSVLQVSIEALHAADGGAVLDDFAIHAMFDLPDGLSVPYVAWRHAAGPVPSRTDRARFIADRATLRRLEVEYRLAGSTVPVHEECALTYPGAPLLSPGHYALLGPRRDGARVDARGFRHSGDASAPLSGLARRDFDYLALRIEAVA